LPVLIKIHGYMKVKVKNVIICLTVLTGMLCAGKGFSQTSGVIRYEEKMDVHKTLPPGMESMKSMIPQFSSTVFRLYFNPTESLYKGFEVDQPPAPTFGAGGFGGPPGGPPGGGGPGGGGPPGGGRGGFRGGFGGSSVNDQVHTNREVVTALNEFLGQSYFMVDSLKVAQWKLGPEKRTILGYECSVAYYTDNSNPAAPVEVTAWYTPKIRPWVGPDRYNTLPGGILALDLNAGEHYWVARKIELRELTEDEKIETPVARKNSKLVTHNEFEKAKLDQMNQMKSRFGGGR
jgi:hypothetical protein